MQVFLDICFYVWTMPLLRLRICHLKLCAVRAFCQLQADWLRWGIFDRRSIAKGWYDLCTQLLRLRLHLHDKLYRSMQKAADSFRQGARNWDDFHPYWRKGLPRTFQVQRRFGSGFNQLKVMHNPRSWTFGVAAGEPALCWWSRQKGEDWTLHFLVTCSRFDIPKVFFGKHILQQLECIWPGSFDSCRATAFAIFAHHGWQFF